MRVFDAIFKLYEKNEIMGSTELDEIRAGQRAWADKVRKNEEAGTRPAGFEGLLHAVAVFVLKWQENWFVRMCVGGLFMWVQHGVYNWMHPELEEDEDDEDDEDDEP